MSVSDQITRLQNAKANIKTSIENKGVTVPDDAKLDAFPALIDDIQAGGSGESHANPDFYELRTNGGTNFDSLFRGYNGPDIDVSKWDTSKVTSARYCFSECEKSMDISKWDLSSLKNASYMFKYFTNGRKYIDLSVLDFSNVANAQYMFNYSNTDYLDVRNINLTGTTSYSDLFNDCSGTELDLSAWDISNIINLDSIFYFSNHKKINLTGWNTVNVTNFGSSFYYAQSLETLLIPDWDMTNATNISSFLYNNPKLKYIDLSRSNDLTIKKIASTLPTKTATTYGEIVIPANTSQEVIDAVVAKYWKPVGPKFDLISIELVFELDEIKPGKTTKVLTVKGNPWYGDDRLETIEIISSNESVATINGREITGVAEGTVDIICRRREDGVVLGSASLSVSETDSNPNLIKFRTNGKESVYYSLLEVNGTGVKHTDCTKDPSTGIYSYDPGTQITNIKFAGTDSFINEIVKFNFNATNMTSIKFMFNEFIGTTLDLSDWDTSKVTNMEMAFRACENLTTINGYIDCSSVEKINGIFYLTDKLETVYFKNIFKNCTMTNDIKWSIDLGYTKVKDECLIYIINELPNLYDKGLTSTSYIDLTLPPTNTLTAEQVQPAIDKGWQVVNTTY